LITRLDAPLASSYCNRTVTKVTRDCNGEEANVNAATIALAGVLALSAMPVSAQVRVDPLATGAISSGDYATAERRLTAERRVYRDRPEILLNLAAVYARTSRVDDARSLYETVLAREPVLMDLTAERTASSHELAASGLQRLGLEGRRFAGK
jgi:Tetratricopeptide repeat